MKRRLEMVSAHYSDGPPFGLGLGEHMFGIADLRNSGPESWKRTDRYDYRLLERRVFSGNQLHWYPESNQKNMHRDTKNSKTNKWL